MRKKLYDAPGKLNLFFRKAASVGGGRNNPCHFRSFALSFPQPAPVPPLSGAGMWFLRGAGKDV
ncbi:MAG: hypothetical protein DRH56_09060 [Deltaproteobacteria bacterium]|nr:MAG: hypothetical protein DRH56_09060 [Deltaproteobacteria bacterium]